MALLLKLSCNTDINTFLAFKKEVLDLAKERSIVVQNESNLISPVIDAIKVVVYKTNMDTSNPTKRLHYLPKNWSIDLSLDKDSGYTWNDIPLYTVVSIAAALNDRFRQFFESDVYDPSDWKLE